MPPLVSIIVPSFQQARFLRATLDSVLTQDWQPLEVLVLDGGSTDGTVEILQSYGDRLWFRSHRDGGQCQAINEGFVRSRGEIVAWLNSDDVYYPGAVRAAVEALTANRSAAAVYGDGNLLDEQGELLCRFPETVPFDLWRLTNVADYILQPCVFFRREALFRCGLLREDLHWVLDWELWMRLGSRLPLAYVPQVLAGARIWGGTKTSTGGWRRLRELLGILRRHGVRGVSPAAVAHTITTVVRAVRPGQELVTAAALAEGMPRGLGAAARPVLARVERWLRRWLDNTQGVWRDGHVGSVGRLWLPSEGRAGVLRVQGRNLEIRDQVVGLRCGTRGARAGPLLPLEPFTLEVAVPPGCIPVKATLSCARTVAVGALDPRYGLRRAGCVLETQALVAS